MVNYGLSSAVKYRLLTAIGLPLQEDESDFYSCWRGWGPV